MAEMTLHDIAKQVVQQYGSKEVRDIINIVIYITYYDVNKYHEELTSRSQVVFDNRHTLKLKIHDIINDISRNFSRIVDKDTFIIENQDLRMYRMGSYSYSGDKTFMIDPDLMDRLTTYPKTLYIVYK